MPYQEQYGNHTLDTIHSFFPALLYDTGAFQTVPQVFSYVNRQMDRHFNLFSSARNAYHAHSPRAPIQAPRSLGLLGLPTTYPTPVTYSDIAQSMYPTHSGISDLLGVLMGQALPPRQVQAQAQEPVIVRPSADQISANTIVEINATEGEMCAICQDAVPLGGQVRTITHCEHSFHVGCIDTWFQTNVRCPVCRHDIRDAEPL